MIKCYLPNILVFIFFFSCTPVCISDELVVRSKIKSIRPLLVLLV